MNFDEIKISPDEMRGRAGEFHTEADKVQEVIDNMTRLAAQIQEEWTGEAARSFGETFEQLRPGFVSAQELVEQFSQNLYKTADAFEKFSEEMGRQWKVQ